ncbi:TRAP transporter small permease subunit [Burkholderia cenocepacia]|nr:TRAP transporter small permease subunit [Burkholderia cenocepacia]
MVTGAGSYGPVWGNGKAAAALYAKVSSLVSRMKPDTAALFEAIAVIAALTFLLLIIVPAYDSAENDTIMTLPATGLSMLWRTAALPFGAALMALTAVVRLVNTVKPSTAFKALLVCGVSVLEGIPAVVLFGPLLFTAAQSVEVHEVHCAMTIMSLSDLAFVETPDCFTIAKLLEYEAVGSPSKGRKHESSWTA